MMGGWINEVQIGYVGGKHSIQIGFVSPSCGYEPTVYMEAASDDIITGGTTFTATISVALHAAACGCSCILHIRD
jgi:hypothetical protein